MAPKKDQAPLQDGTVEEIEISEASRETEAADEGVLRFPPSGTKGWG
jgi:hypothetical protein